MKALIIYDTLYGNTEQVAKAIADGLKSAAEVRVLKVDEVKPDELPDGFDLVIIGSPTQRGRPTIPMEEFLRAIPFGTLHSVKLAAFDTRISFADRNVFVRWLINRLGYAAPKIVKILRNKDSKPAVPPEGFIVKEGKGPLADGELQRATEWGRSMRI
jgi:flavodoxin